MKGSQLGVRVERLGREPMRERVREDRTELNKAIAEDLILAKWTDGSNDGPGEGYKFFCALLARAAKGQSAHPKGPKPCCRFCWPLMTRWT